MILFQLPVQIKQLEIFYDILLPLELCKSPSKVQEMAFQTLVLKFSRGTCPWTPYTVTCRHLSSVDAKCAPHFYNHSDAPGPGDNNLLELQDFLYNI